MSPGTRPSQKSPRGFFRLEPIQSHSSSGEARFSLNHVADNEPFVTESKRPWVSRRKSRRKDPPWKKFVTVFKVAPVPVSFGNASPIEPETPAAQFSSFEMENQSVASIESTSFVDFLLQRLISVLMIEQFYFISWKQRLSIGSCNVRRVSQQIIASLCS
jgi:hypothetical protein